VVFYNPNYEVVPQHYANEIKGKSLDYFIFREKIFDNFISKFFSDNFISKISKKYKWS